MNNEYRPRVPMRLLLALVAVALLIVPSMLAQVERTSSMQGTVKDPSGAVVAGATVDLSGAAIIAGTKTTTTDSTGYYHFELLRPGTYNLTVSKSGFATYKQTGIDLAVGRGPTIDVTMKVGQASETVEITGAAPQIDVASSKVQTNVTQQYLDNIPVGRSYQSVIQFAPGARSEPMQGGAGGGLGQTLGYQIDGAANSENSYMVEGQETADIRFGNATTNVPMEFTQEIVIKSSGFEAEHGGAMGGIVNVIQKRGGNSWHGSLFTYYQGDTLDSAPNRLYSNSYQPKKDHYRIWEPGFEVGGYLVKDKLWVFASSVPRLYRQTRTVFMTQINNNRSFQQSSDTYYSLGRVDAQPWQKLHLFGSWQYNYYKINGSSQPGPDDVFGQTNPSGAGSNPDNYNGGIGNRQPSMILGAGGDLTITQNLIASSRWGRQYYGYFDVGLPAGIRYYYRNTSYLPNTPNGSYDFTLAPANTCQGPVTTTHPMGADYSCSDPLATTTTPGSGVIALDGTTLDTVGLPALIQASGYTTLGANFATIFDKYWRSNFAEDVSYFHKGWGTHNFKFGYLYTKLSNNVIQGYNSAYALVGYDREWSPVVSAGGYCADSVRAIQNFNLATWPGDTRSGDCRGLWGTINFQEYGAFGLASSTMHAFYVQDAWNIGHGITLNLGVRFENEHVPTYTPGFPSINFGLSEKFAPRLGASWDILGNGKLKAYGSFGYFYNPMKYDLPRGSFGGNYWHDCVYALDSPNWPTDFVPIRGADGHYCEPTGGASSASTVVNPFGRPGAGTLIANEDFRIPSNDPAGACDALLAIPGSCVDALLHLKPMKQHEIVLGVDWQIKPGLALETRWARKRLDKAIEDTGVIGPDGEQYSLTNPGFGFNAIMYGPGLNIPKAIRKYDGIEFRLTKAANAKWFGSLSYTYSRDYGNYSGGTNTDIADGGGGRQSNTSRAFDEPMGSFDAHGHPIDGPLATDRPHTFKAAGFYRLKWWKMETTVGAFQQLYSGSPLSSYFDIYGMNSEVEGRGNWIDITGTKGSYVASAPYARRTPKFSQTDLNFVQEFHVSKENERLKLGLEATFTNIFNQHSPIYYYSRVGGIYPCDAVCAASAAGINYEQLLTGNYNYMDEFNGLGASGPAQTLRSTYGKPYGWQQPRTIRFKLSFTF